MKKVLFLIHDLGHGGAEKVLVNLVNNMDPGKFDITVMTLFGGGVNEQFLAPHIRHISCFRKAFPGNSHVMKLFSPQRLHKWLIKEHYDIEVSYLEGPSARVISGCQDRDTKLVSWIHIEMHHMKVLAASFRSPEEAMACYNRFDQTVCVSEYVKKDFCSILHFQRPCAVLYNTNESEQIVKMAQESVDMGESSNQEFRWCGVGKLTATKGFDRMLRIQSRLISEGYHTHFNALGIGPDEKELRQYCDEQGIADTVTFWGYQTNPYKYIAKCDLFVCASHAEGFSTAATEALIVGIPVCTVEVSGMKEMLGENNEYGIVTDNTDEALYRGIKSLLDDPALLAHYREKAVERGKFFSTKNTVAAVENMLLSL